MATPAKIIEENLPTVALVGRVNVGKSTLFNKLIGQNRALVSKIPGTTRTPNTGKVFWRGQNFRLIDTGGLTFSDDVPLEKEIIAQTEMALAKADAVIFLTDIQTGLLPQERELARRLIKNKERVLFTANKADNERLRLLAHEKDWLKLGLGAPLPISAASGANVGELLERVFAKLGKLKKRPKKIKEIAAIKVAIVGRPNVGKSSLFNNLIGAQSAIVSDMPHTTREPLDTLVNFESHPIVFVDTAGIRRKAKVAGELEREGIAKSIQMIQKSDIVLLVLDTGEPLSSQDQQLGGLLRENTKSVIIVLNKWDLAESNEDSFRNEVKKRIYGAFPHLDFAPIVFTSAKTQYRVHQIFPLILRAWDERHTIIPEEKLDEFWKKVSREHRPARGKGTRHPKILGFCQLRASPPMFEMQIKAKTSLHFSYVRYIENRLREHFGFFATPIVIKLTKVKR
ncbi:ribosome biogenesis GTPase Der [Patescibacteria group bacterium]|nr:MAG: ribosome biogenesis GTPase Der [Patescibacteria group bacterium]